MKLSQKLKKFRSDNNLTQTDFANNLGISRTHLAMIETDKRPANLELLKKIALVSNKNLKWWVSGTEYDDECYEEMSALSMLLDYMIDKKILTKPDDIENEMDHIIRLLKEEVNIKLKKYNKINKMD
ncbi:helix-turn-helix domain-containing protein [Clostridium botulinum]|uniref:helix-turn-helix domain-containing protein n=1 Tax=Clostridium botulinum TaxID=1491 RepID=UPI001E3C4DA5|nr:helix-turn-helix domain-containing protein [Clostridium botulinum]MCD3202844.1 helix-turn-helix transcriptional regulator [Clostridium botulinum C/D]MCD3230868.1 helix-turn-helix transcriptional regulator [Clostridium botulinum C/D]MCD3253946.1 helix-turn-helix transcriptional regulator [Clostridium botulinum C/D]MCD3279458.1 helix-turn-helix transcriptional regulator [Clostridium botulinum C/D]MCD3282771.1 helix-turn-helix transcriptional regulator [Clostridium botulinum C/D]